VVRILFCRIAATISKRCIECSPTGRRCHPLLNSQSMLLLVLLVLLLLQGSD
jgi:hypothetical protein